MRFYHTNPTFARNIGLLQNLVSKSTKKCKKEDFREY